MSFVETYLFDGDTRHPASREGGRRRVAVRARAGQGDRQAHRESGGTLHTYVALSRPQDWFAGIDFTDSAAATARIAQEFDGWAPELTALITDSDTAPVLRPHLRPAGRAPVGPGAGGDPARRRRPPHVPERRRRQPGHARRRRTRPGHRRAPRRHRGRAHRVRAGACSPAAPRPPPRPPIIFEACYGDNAPHSLVNFLTGHEQAQ